MNNKIEFERKKLENCINEIIESCETQNNKDLNNLLELRESLIELVTTCISNHLTPTKNSNSILDFISSDEVIIEVKDKDTNKIFRRNLEISYIENSNGLKLIGENFKGQPSEIVFLSDTAVNKIKDVTGNGLNKARCNH